MLTSAQLETKLTAAELLLLEARSALRAAEARADLWRDVAHSWQRVSRSQAQLLHPAPARPQGHGTDDGEYISFAEWADRKAGRDREDSYR